jgi:predicted acyl esterase
MRARMPLLLLLLTLVAPPLARAHVQPFGALACAPRDGVRFCPGQTSAASDQRIRSFDGTPLDADVALPATGDANLPLVVLLHGWGGSKAGFVQMKAWADRGYAVLSYTARGFNGSCGRPDNRAFAAAACASGWLHLADVRFEARDTQFLAGRLADQGIIDGRRVGVTGPSYAGGQSMELAALKDRVMDPDGSLHPWVSDGGHPLRIAAAAPTIPWTDLAYALEPNGRTLDYTITSPTDDVTPIGVSKQSFVGGLYALGQATGYYSPPGVELASDLTTWFARVNAGEPTDPVAEAIARETTTFHSAYYLDHSEAPSPLLISNGWTDDLFPVDEALRFYNRSQAQYPDDPIALMFFDFGHMRGTGKPADTALLQERQFDWFDHYVKGDTGVPVPNGVETLTQTCPASAPSGGPFFASSWSRLHPGEVRFLSGRAHRVSYAGGRPDVSRAIDPVAGGGNACAATTSADQRRTATYRLPKATGRGYTLMGSPTVIADVKVAGIRVAANAELAARLWDVGRGGKQTLVARGLYRPTGSGRQVFQLHPNGWRFAAGHVPKLELLGNDAPYGRASNFRYTITVSKLDFRLPTHERAGKAPQVHAPAAPFLPTGAKPTADAAAAVRKACSSRRSAAERHRAGCSGR